MSATTTQQLIKSIGDDDECIRRDGDRAQAVAYTVKEIRTLFMPTDAKRVEALLANQGAGGYVVVAVCALTNTIVISFRNYRGGIQHITLKNIQRVRGTVKVPAWFHAAEALEFANIAHVVKYWMHAGEPKQLEDCLNKAREHAAALQTFLHEADAAVGGAVQSATNLIAASINVWYNGDSVDSELSLAQWLDGWRSQTSACCHATELAGRTILEAILTAATKTTLFVALVDAVQAEVRACYTRLPQNIGNRLVCDLEALASTRQ